MVESRGQGRRLAEISPASHRNNAWIRDSGAAVMVIERKRRPTVELFLHRLAIRREFVAMKNACPLSPASS